MNENNKSFKEIVSDVTTILEASDDGSTILIPKETLSVLLESLSNVKNKEEFKFEHLIHHFEIAHQACEEQIVYIIDKIRKFDVSDDEKIKLIKYEIEQNLLSEIRSIQLCLVNEFLNHDESIFIASGLMGKPYKD
jgi:hypothetical protein